MHIRQWREERRRNPWFFGLHAHPTLRMNIFLPFIPFLIVISVYIVASGLRHEVNPDDKLLPTISKMAQSVYEFTLAPDGSGEEKNVLIRFAESQLVGDTLASARRIAIGLGMGAFAGLLIGMNLALFPGMRILFNGFFTFFGIIPPLAMLPILFFAFGVDELGKIMLVFIGITPGIAGMIFLAASAISREQITKVLTLGGSELQIIYRIVLRQMLPRLIDAIRLSLGPACLFLIAAEATSATLGLGFRIYLVRRYFAMDVIIPYVIWITFLLYLFDILLSRAIARLFPWYLARE